MTAPAAEEQVSATIDKATEDVGKAVDGILAGDLDASLPLIENYLIPVASSLLFLIVGYFAARFLSRALSNPVSRKVDQTLGGFLQKLIFYSLITFVVVGILGKFGVNVASLAAVVAAAGFAVGLAFQGTLSNFASGVLLIVFRPFKVSQFVTVAGESGTVQQIDLFTTTLDTVDNKRIIIPNSRIFGEIITNFSHNEERRVDISVGCAYDADINETRAALEKAVERCSEFKVERGHQVILLSLGDSSVNWQVRIWTQAPNYWKLWELATQSVKESLDEAGISIPFPQLDVEIKPGSQIAQLKVAND